MFIAALFTIAKMWKQPKRPWKDEWIKKKCYIYKMEYDMAIINEFLLSAMTGMGIECIVLNEISQTEKDKWRMILLICGILKNKINEQEGQK